MADLEQVPLVDEKYVLEQYQGKIDYYWKASRSNKNAYKSYRAWSIILGASVTLISSISAAEFIQTIDGLRIVFAIATPIIAATLTIISGLGQNFHWGTTWRDMVINATRLEMERDRFRATRPEQWDFQKELNVMNSIILDETKSFFERVLDSEGKSTKPSESSSNWNGPGGAVG